VEPLNDQVVLIYSGFFTAVYHPLILRRLLIVVIRREGEVSVGSPGHAAIFIIRFYRLSFWSLLQKSWFTSYYIVHGQLFTLEET